MKVNKYSFKNGYAMQQMFKYTLVSQQLLSFVPIKTDWLCYLNLVNNVIFQN